MNDKIIYEVGNGLYINLTNRCPCECSFCIRNTGDGINPGESLWLATEPSLEDVIATLDNVDLAVYGEVVFCGYGEPTERLDVLLKTAEHIKQNNPKTLIRLNTNGLSDLINRKKTAELLAANVDSVSISLNAPNKEDYVKMCHPAFGEKSFEAIIEFGEEAKRYFKEVCFTVVDVLCSKKIKQCEELCSEMNIKMRVRSVL